MKSAAYKKKCLEVLDSLSGNISEMCKATGVSRTQFYKWMENEKFKSKVDEIRERVVDNVESALYKNALEGNVAAQIFFLKTQGKKRGYVEKVEVKHEGAVLPPWMKQDDEGKQEPDVSS